jgi:hypothetical protein
MAGRALAMIRLTARAIAAPVIPSLGIKTRFAPMFKVNATVVLNKLNELLPFITNKMSTGPKAAPIITERDRITNAVDPDSNPGPKTIRTVAAKTEVTT